MKIDVSGLQASRTAARGGLERLDDAEPCQRTVDRTDDVIVSERAEKLSLGRSAFQAVPDVRDDMVEAARAKLSAGHEATDGRAIARAMIDTISQESA
ncbi:MAG: hypothetical protein GF393_05825 [Armatimonadia bacterium]|nr:hypothetical protein [Armatimonadia bacterium]